MKEKIIAIIALFFLSGCGALQLSPIANEEKIVQLANNASLKVEIEKGMVFYDSSPPNRAIRFPEGKYTLEAEDKEYYYFRAPSSLQMRIFKGNKVIDGRDILGGLMLGKSRIMLLPGGGYIDGPNGNKVLIWKLGKEFLEQENKAWKKNYKD